MKRERRVDRLARVSHAVKTAVLRRARLPALEAALIKLAVLRIEPRAHQTAVELQRELHHARLRHALDRLGHHMEERAFAVALKERQPLERPPFVARDIDLPAAGIIRRIRHPANRLIVVRRDRRVLVPAHELHLGARLGIARIDDDVGALARERQLALRGGRHAVEAAGLDEVQLARGHPVALIVARQNLVVRPDRHAVRRAETGREHLEFRAVLRDAEQRALMRRLDGGRPRRAFEEEKIAVRICVQIEAELVVILRDDRVVVEIFVKIRRAVAVQIMQARDLIAAEHVHFVIDDFEAERLKQARRKPPPRELAERVVDAAHNPHVAVKRANRRAPVREKVEAAEERFRLPLVRQTVGDDIHGVRAVVRAKGALRDDLLGEECRTALGQRGEVGKLFFDSRGGDELFQIRDGAAPDREFERAFLPAVLNRENAARLAGGKPHRAAEPRDGGGLSGVGRQGDDVAFVDNFPR